jgi:hypothetical protein
MYLVYLGVFECISTFFSSRNTPLYLGFEIQRVFGLRDTVKYNQIPLNAPQILIAKVTKYDEIQTKRTSDTTLLHDRIHSNTLKLCPDTSARVVPDTLKYSETRKAHKRNAFTPRSGHAPGRLVACCESPFAPIQSLKIMWYRSVSGCIWLYFVYPRLCEMRAYTTQYTQIHEIQQSKYGVWLRFAAFECVSCSTLCFARRMQILLDTSNTVEIHEIHETELRATPAHYCIRLYLSAFGNIQIQSMNTLKRTKDAVKYSQIH